MAAGTLTTQDLLAARFQYLTPIVSPSKPNGTPPRDLAKLPPRPSPKARINPGRR